MKNKFLHKIAHLPKKENHQTKHVTHVQSPTIEKQFKWDGKVSTLLKNLDQADAAFSFNVEYKGKSQGKELPLNGKATELDIYNDTGEHVVPVGSTLYRDDRATWHIKKGNHHE